MAKPATKFRAPAEDRDEIAPAEPEPQAAAPTTSSSEIASTSAPKARPKYREGKRNLSVWLDQRAFNSFKAMVAEDGVTIQDYVIEMLNREFARRGRPQIAK